MTDRHDWRDLKRDWLAAEDALDVAYDSRDAAAIATAKAAAIQAHEAYERALKRNLAAESDDDD